MKKKALALILSLTMLVSSVVPGLLVSANGTTTSDITTIEEVETPLSSEPDDETQPPEGGSTTNPTNPGEGGTEGGTTNPGEGGTEGGTTNPGEGGTEGGTTNPGEGGTEGGTTNPGEGGTEGGTTNPGEGGTEGGTTNPGEGEGGETDISAEELYNRFMACTTIEEIETLKAQVSEEDWAKLSEEQKKAIEEYIETLKAQTQTAKFEDRYNRIMSAQTSAEVEAIIKEFADEAELEAFMKWMQDNGKLEALQQHLSDVYASEYEAPVTVSVTNAGPLLPPIYVGGMQRAFSATPFSDTDKNGLDLSKTVTANEDGTYTITLEAFTTGTVSTTTESVPLDIVLVLDQSGSMDETFGTSWRDPSRQEAMQTAVNKFIGEVGKKYSTTSDHRISIVRFSSDASVAADWTYTNAKGVSDLQRVVSNLSNGGDTYVDEGMNLAKIQLEKPYTGDNTNRQRVVILFTDGVPAPQDTNVFNISMANDALQAAKEIKDSKATVYTIGIFEGANPYELSGNKGYDKQSDGSLGSVWAEKRSGSYDHENFTYAQTPAGNRFLNYLSTNYPDATEIGLEEYSERYDNGWWDQGYYYGYKINQNFERTAPASDNYYLTASDEAGLNKIFEEISKQISNPSISLGTGAVVRDVVSPYFTAPTDANEIHVYTADAQADGSFADKKVFNDNPKITISGDTIEVTNFDFDKNFVSSTPREGNFYGRKLIVEFNVKPKPGFLGGNNVPTNGTESGVYFNDNDKDGNPKSEKFDVPNTDVAIPAIKKITAADKNVYLMSDLTADQIKEGVTVTLNAQDSEGEYITLDLSPEAKNYGLEDWQTKFVTIDVELTDDKGQEIKPEDLIEDQTYNVKVTISPRDSDSETAQNGEGAVQIKVFKPEITWKDSQIDLGQSPNYTDGDNRNLVKVEWKHQPKEGDPDLAPGSMGTAPTLTYTFDPEAAAFQQETNVKVTGVKVGETNVPEEKLSDCITFLHDDAACDFPGCKWEEAKEEGYHFIVHIKSFDLIIHKTGTVDSEQTFVFEVKNEGTDDTIEVVIKGANSKTIKGLPSGNYTVTEKTDWSWRYDPDEETKTVIPRGATAKVTFNNTLKSEQKWLNGYAYQPNDFVTAATNLVNTLLSVIK